MWFIYALLGAIITGVGQMFVKKGQIKLSPLMDNLLAAIIVNLLLVPFLFFRGINFSAGKDIILYALIAASMYATFYYIISKGNVSIMISLINAYPVVTIALAILFLHELPNAVEWFGIVITLLGVVCVSSGKGNNSFRRMIYKKNTWVGWGLFGALALGIAEFVTKIATLHADGFTFTFFVYIMYIPPLLLFLLLDRKGRKFERLTNKSSLFFTCVGIFFIESGLIAIALAYQHGLASLVSPVVASNMLITVLLAAYFLKEKIQVIQKIGIFLTLVGVIVIGM
jgi:uncharacterized membrane protein